MELHNEIVIEAPAERVWRALGERFMHVSEWAAPIEASCPIGEQSPGVGVTRACTIAPFGPFDAGIVKERLTRFDADAMAFEYEALEGMPRFIERAVNRWSVESIDAHRSRVRIHATVSLRGAMRLFGWLFAWQMRSAGSLVAEELKHFVETGQPHPRKQAALSARRETDKARAQPRASAR
ncbi:MAG: SRPBCC family protein [Myxococcales bacterium]|nr:SRPBCC family protein [Myxococcales bacterium]